MSLELVEARPSDRVCLRAMLERYLRELSRYEETSMKPAESAEYPYLDAYWEEPGRYAYFVKEADSFIGFVFVRGPASTGNGTYEMAEFYIEPAFRRLGWGGAAAANVWQRFPGDWAFHVYGKNQMALQFWANSIKKFSGQEPQIQETQNNRVPFCFRIP